MYHNNDNRIWTAAGWQQWRTHIAIQDRRIHELRARQQTPGYRII
jgi:hypothetical protein